MWDETLDLCCSFDQSKTEGAIETTSKGGSSSSSSDNLLSVLQELDKQREGLKTVQNVLDSIKQKRRASRNRDQIKYDTFPKKTPTKEKNNAIDSTASNKENLENQSVQKKDVGIQTDSNSPPLVQNKPNLVPQKQASPTFSNSVVHRPRSESSSDSLETPPKKQKSDASTQIRIPIPLTPNSGDTFQNSFHVEVPPQSLESISIKYDLPLPVIENKGFFTLRSSYS